MADSIESMIDTAVSEPVAEPVSEPEPEVSEPATEPSEPVAEPEPTPEPEPEPAQPEVEDDPFAEIEPVKTNGKLLTYEAAKAKRMLAALDFQRQLDKEVPGATLDTIKSNYERAVGFEAMLSDYNSGDPQRVGDFVNFWLAEQARPESVAAFAEALPNALQRFPQAAQSLERAIIGAKAQALYDEYRRTGDEATHALAANLDNLATGKFMDRAQLQQIDPLAQREASLKEREDRINQQSRNERNQFLSQQARITDDSLDSAIKGEIENALSPVKEAFGNTPHWRHMTRDLQEAVTEARNANPTWSRQFGIKYNEVRNNPSAKGREELAAMMKQFAGRVIAAQKKAIIESATGTVVGTSAASHQKLAAVAQRKEPAGAGAVQRSTLAQKVSAAKTMDDAFKEIGW